MYSNQIYVVIGSYDISETYRDSYVIGIYSDYEKAERAAYKFTDLSKDDEDYCARATTISSHYVDSGWYEEYWNVQ